MTPAALDRLGDDVATIAAVAGVVVLGLQGVTDPLVLGSIAGLGGYRLRQRSRERTGGRDDG